MFKQKMQSLTKRVNELENEVKELKKEATKSKASKSSYLDNIQRLIPKN